LLLEICVLKVLSGLANHLRLGLAVQDVLGEELDVLTNVGLIVGFQLLSETCLQPFKSSFSLVLVRL